MTKPVILTGLRSNGEYHLGNYLGGILPMIDLQGKYADEYRLHMFIPDLHSFSTPVDHSSLYDQSMRNLRMFAAAGLALDHEGTLIYRQSRISAHSELAWILSNFTYHGELSRMTQFKDKSGSGESVSAALFSYPVLMAADILLYGARYVPVGEDQRQHLELARDIAERMNNKFGAQLFELPEPWSEQLKFMARESGVRIRSLRDPSVKMSKSVDDPAGTITLTDEPAVAAKKVMSATTDSYGEIKYDPADRPGISNLLQIAALLGGQPLTQEIATWSGTPNYGDLKRHVAELVTKFLISLQSGFKDVDESSLETRLAQDEAAANAIAEKRLHRVQAAVGLRKPEH